jgi:hypothetical protein
MQGYAGVASELFQNGLQRSIGFARNYLQPGAEKRIANEIVEIQSATD